MRYIAFLRGINVSGQKLIKMEELKKHFEVPGFSNITTYIQSGNVLFDTKETDGEKLRKKIEKQLSIKLGYHVPVVVRSLDEMRTTIANNPYPQQSPDDKRKLYIVFLSAAPDASVYASLDSYLLPGEELRIVGNDIFILTSGIGNSKLALPLIEKKLGVTATMRNWATTNKVVDL